MRTLLIALLSFSLGLAVAHAAHHEGAAVASPEHPVAQLGEGSVWTAPSGKARVIKAVEGDNAFLALLQIDPGAGVPKHRDATEEFVVFVEGGGTMTINGTEHAVAKGSAVYMAPNDLVSFANGDAQSTVIQVFAGPEPAAKYEAWIQEPAQ